MTGVPVPASAQRNALGELVESVGAANNWSLRDIATRAQQHGHELSHQRLSQLCRGPIPGIQADKIHAIAAGLKVSPALVAAAALEGMGIVTRTATLPTPARAIRQDPDLSVDTKRALLAILRDAGNRDD